MKVIVRASANKGKKIIRKQSGRTDLMHRVTELGVGSALDHELLAIIFNRYDDQEFTFAAGHIFDKLGGMTTILNADDSFFQSMPGITNEDIVKMKCFRELRLRSLFKIILGRNAEDYWREIIEYYRAAIAYKTCESFHVLFLNSNNIVMADEQQQRGTIDHTPVYIREIFRRAMDFAAKSIILIHNHPSGDPTPSKPDIEMTRLIADAGKPLRIAIYDHLIVAKCQSSSLRQLGLLH